MKTQVKSMPVRLAQVLLLGAVALCLTACTQQIQSAGQILLNVEKDAGYIINLIVSFSYLAGAGFMFKGIFAFKVYGEQRTMMSSQTSIRIPIVYVAVGACLLGLPQVISIASQSLFMQATVNIISYPGDIDSMQNVAKAVFGMMQVIGLIAIVRAFFIVSNPHPGGGQGGLGKATIHFIGGMFALNIKYTLDLLGLGSFFY